MCLTLANAATIHHHTDPTGTTGSSARGYTATTHHAGHLTPGDQWRPIPDQPPRTVTDIHRRHGVHGADRPVRVRQHLDLPRHRRHPDRRPRPPAPAPHPRGGRRQSMTTTAAWR